MKGEEIYIEGICVGRDKEQERIIKLINNNKQDCRSEIKVWLKSKEYTEGWNDCLEELKAKIKGARK